MLYAVIFALLLLVAYMAHLLLRADERHASERASWVQERQDLINRIQFPHIAQAQAVNAAFGEPAQPQSEEERARQKWLDKGIDPDQARIPPTWG